MTLKQIVSIEAVKLKRPANIILFSLILLLYIGLVASNFYDFNTEESGDINKVLFQAILQMEGGFIGFFIAIFIIMNIGKEYSDGTFKKNIIDGYTRSQFYTGKVIILILTVLLISIFGKVVMLGGSLLIGHFGDAIRFFTAPVLINSLLKIITAGIFALFLSFLTRNLTMSLVLYLLWGAMESLISQLSALFLKINNVSDFLPQSSIQNILKQEELIHPAAIVMACIYIFLMLFIPYFLILKRDIK